MRTENNDGLTTQAVFCGDIIKLINKDCAALAQGINHKFVVHHLVPHIYRRAIYIQRTIDNIDGTVHTSAETTRVGELDFCFSA